MRWTSKLLYLIIPALLTFLTFSAAATTIIDTISSWTGQGEAPWGGVGPFGGAGGVYAYGQTFVAPPESILHSLTVFIRDDFVADVPVEFRTYIAKWLEEP